MSRRKIEAEREQMGLQDAAWELYTQEGPSLDELLRTKPTNATTVVWTKETGWIS